MNLNYHEKSIWASLVSTVIIFGVYFTMAFKVMNDPNIPDITLIFFFIGAVITIVIVQIILQTILAIMNRKVAEGGHDERDKAIEMRSTQYSYYILIFGIWASVAAMLINFSTLLLINLIMLTFIVAEVVSYITTLIHYRRGY